MPEPDRREENRVKYLPWVILIIILGLIFYNLPKASNSSSKKEKRAEKKAEKPAKQSQTTPSPPPAQENARIEITTDLLNFRSKPDLSSKTVLATLKRGTQATILEKQERWLKIQLDDGRVGFISYKNKYIRFINGG